MNDRHDEEVRRYALTLIGQLCAGDPPLIGTTAWVEAPGPVRLAALVRGGLALYESADPHRLAAAVEHELEAARRADEADYLAWRQVAGRVRAGADSPTFDELQRRRAVVGRTGTTDQEMASATVISTTNKSVISTTNMASPRRSA